MSVIPVGYAEVFAQIGLTGDNELMGVVFGIDSVSPFNQTEANEVSTAIATFLRAVMGSSYAYVGCRITVGNDGGPLIFDSVAGLGVGVQDSQSVPQNTALLFKKASQTGGRRGRGRMYVPGVGETKVDSAGNVLAAFITTCNTEAATLLSSLSASGNPMVILHDTPGVTPSTVTTMTCSSKVATQRRRLR